MAMNLYLITQDSNDDVDVYAGAVVVAANEEEAKTIHPGGSFNAGLESWVAEEDIKVTFLGKSESDHPAYSVVISDFLNG